MTVCSTCGRAGIKLNKIKELPGRPICVDTESCNAERKRLEAIWYGKDKHVMEG